MLTDKGHDFSLDWWTLGILLYEMVTGIPPFYNKERPVMFRNIRSAKVRFPNKNKDNFEVLPAAQDLILQLLQKNPTKRIGYQGGVQEILKHEFFNGLDIDKLLKFELTPPYMPQIKDEEFFDQKLVKQKDLEFTMLNAKQQKDLSKATEKDDPFANFAR